MTTVLRRSLLLLPLVLLAGCVCARRGCELEGLLIRLEGNFEPGKVYLLEIREVVYMPALTPFMQCSLMRGGDSASLNLRCTSERGHSESARSIQIHDTGIRKMVVSVSADGNMLGQQTLDARYNSEEINGPGCGTCTSAEVAATIP